MTDMKMPSTGQSLKTPSAEQAANTKLLVNLMNQVFQRVAEATHSVLFESQSLQVTQLGNGTWDVYDPQSRQHFFFESKYELSVWIEKRYLS